MPGTRKKYVARWLYHWLCDSCLGDYSPDFDEAMIEETLTDEQVDKLLVGYFHDPKEDPPHAS